MTSKTTKVTKKSKTKQSPSTVLAATNFQLKGSDWLALPLSVLVFICAYTFTSTLPSHSYFTFSNPTIISFLVGIFSALYVYKVIRKSPRFLLANVIAYIFSVALVILAGIVIATSFNECGSNCNTSSALVAWVVVFNPLLAPLWSPLAIIGAIALLAKRSTRQD